MAIGRIVMRSKERLVAIRPLDGVLCVETMRYADEVVPVDDLVPDDRRRSSPRRSARWRAARRVARGPRRSSPRSTTTSTASSCSTSSSARQSGEEIIAEPQTEPPAKVLDLVAALEASIAKSKTAKERHPTGAGDAQGGEARRHGEARDQGHQGHEGAGQEGGTREEERLASPRGTARAS